MIGILPVADRRRGDAVIAMGGAWGTLSEIALARSVDRAAGRKRFTVKLTALLLPAVVVTVTCTAPYVAGAEVGATPRGLRTPSGAALGGGEDGAAAARRRASRR